MSTQNQKPIKFAADLLVLAIVFYLMQVGNGKTVFNELVPDNATCPQWGDFGCLCDNSFDCNKEKFLECIDGKCTCEYPLHRTFDDQLGKCVTLVGSQCVGSGNRTPECVRNSECEVGRCLCREGYSPTVSKVCMISYGQACGPNLCNFDRGLGCREGTCQCVDSSYVYSAVTTICIDPEAVVRDIIERITDRILREIFNFKLRRGMQKLMKSFRYFKTFIRRVVVG